MLNSTLLGHCNHTYIFSNLNSLCTRRRQFNFVSDNQAFAFSSSCTFKHRCKCRRGTKAKHQSFHDQFFKKKRRKRKKRKLTRAGSLNLKPLSKAEIALISSSVKSKSPQFKFSTSLSGEFVLGMTAMPRWVHHRKTICAGVLW